MSQTLVERYGLAAADIEERSFQIIDRLVPGDLLPADPADRAVAKRIIHAAGDPGLAPLIAIAPGAVAGGVAALRRGCPILTDVRMVAVGVSRDLAGKFGNPIVCLLDDARVPAKARAEGTTRAVAAVRLRAADLAGAVVAIGNAPTALLALLDLVDAGVGGCPALVVGIPVGFVNAAEAKEELVGRKVPYITVRGHRGGSPLAAAAVNALLKLATGLGGPGDHYRERDRAAPGPETGATQGEAGLHHD